MTLQQMYYFLEVVKTRHFTKAAQNLYVSQSALSHSIQAMEREVGAPLFIREKLRMNRELISVVAERTEPPAPYIIDFNSRCEGFRIQFTQLFL